MAALRTSHTNIFYSHCIVHLNSPKYPHTHDTNILLSRESSLVYIFNLTITHFYFETHYNISLFLMTDHLSKISCFQAFTQNVVKLFLSEQVHVI